MTKDFLMGAEIQVKGALAAGAEIFYGYPITPTTDVMHYWVEEAEKSNGKLKFLQTEDEIAAGFHLIGAVLSGKKAFTTTSGPGNILMQDAFSMAEAMRLPVVALINQRGGPSTGTVIYSQQELYLTCYGGNGEGHRIVYSTSGVQDLYDYTIKAFNIAWKYHFPTFVLADGYQAKMMDEVELYEPSEKKIELIKSISFLGGKKQNPPKYQQLRNTYNLEEELFEVIMDREKDYQMFAPQIEEVEIINPNSKIMLFAHGIVAAAARVAISELQRKNVSVGLFRPITLLPFPTEKAKQAIVDTEKILVTESSLGQFSRHIKAHLFGIRPKIYEYLRPAMGITPEEIVEEVEKII